MATQTESSILTGRITQIGGRYLWIDSGTRFVVLPGLDMRPLRVGMRVTVKAVRRHGQLLAETIAASPDRSE